MKYFRSEIKEGDDILFRNICKEKKMPGTKKQLKYHGPVTASKVTQSHALVLKADSWKMKKVPLTSPENIIRGHRQIQANVNLLPYLQILVLLRR